jgi:hypothetical protein
LLAIHALVLASSHSCSAKGTEATADSSAFKTATALVANDAADSSATETAEDGSSVGVGSRAGSHGEGDRCGAKDFEE